jgi:plasmid stabilization system protein ParE
MSFAVFLTHDAARGLEEVYDYLVRHDTPRKADYVLIQIERVFSRLSEFLARRAILKNCLRSGFANTVRFSSNPTVLFTPAAKSHRGFLPGWMNVPTVGRDVAPVGRRAECHGLCPWGSTGLWLRTSTFC